MPHCGRWPGSRGFTHGGADDASPWSAGEFRNAGSRPVELRQIAVEALILGLHRLGVSTERLARLYPRGAMIMRPAVVIPTLNECGWLADTLKAILMVAGGRELEITVVDGGSSDGTTRLAGRHGIRVLRCEPGRARQMNLGARCTQGDPLVFVHADTCLPPQALDIIEECLRDPSVTHGSFPIRLDRPEWCYRLIAAVANLRTRFDRTPYGDQALFVRRAAFEAAGGFPDHPVLEDVALARRLRQTGRYVFLPGPHVSTSARRWSTHGLLKTTLVNWTVRLGYELGVRPERLASLRSRAGRPRPSAQRSSKVVTS